MSVMDRVGDVFVYIMNLVLQNTNNIEYMLYRQEYCTESETKYLDFSSQTFLGTPSQRSYAQTMRIEKNNKRERC